MQVVQFCLTIELNHRGRANLTSEPRPVSYLAYAKPFFRDAGNIRSRHSLISQSPNSRQSLVWVARILSSDPVLMGEGLIVSIIRNRIRILEMWMKKS